jgi:hypothetical protein
MVTEWTRTHDKHEAMRLVRRRRAAGAVLDTGELLGEPSFESRGSCRCSTRAGR